MGTPYPRRRHTRQSVQSIRTRHGRTLKIIRNITASSALAAAIPAAHAQSSVTLYGLIDEGITYLNNQGGHSLVKAEDYNLSASRIGFTGREDLGGGTAAIFKLESGLNVNTGALRQGGLQFGRGAWVGLTNDKYGTLTMGRNWDQMTLALAVFHPAITIGLNGATPGDADRVCGEFLNNSITYTSPNLKGFQFSAEYSLAGDGTSTTNGGAALSGGATYTNGAFNAGVALTRVNAATFAPGAALGLNEAFGVPVKSTTSFVLDQYRTVGVGASYQFKPVRVAAIYTNTHYELHADDTMTLQMFGLSAIYQVTPSLSSSVGYLHSKMADSTWNIYSAILDQSLSKRTDVYVSADFEKATGPHVVAQLALEGPSSTGSQLALRVGLRHRF
jgi:outer membrane protein OmpU